MADKKIKWTDQQTQAIRERGRDVLVTASAGTGKTAVLSGRAVDIVSDKNLCPDLWSILVLTFTDAAAEQMRQRIAEQLADAYLRSKDEHLRRQLALLQGADISTIHSFCKKLITEHFYQLELDPAFGIIDADEQRLLKSSVLEQTIEWAWQQDALVPMLEELLAGRDIRPGDGFLRTIIETSDFLEGVTWRDGWYNKAVELCRCQGVDGDAAAKQKRIIELKLDESLARLAQVERIYERHNPTGEWLQKFTCVYCEPVTKLRQALQKSWSDFASLIDSFNKPRVNLPKELDEDVKELIKAEIQKAYSIIKEFKQLAVLNPDYLAKVGSKADRQSLALIELVKKFEQLYSQAKRAINRLDFADLERYALVLLAEPDSLSDKPRPSQIALGLREKYKYVFVDEYQDINPVQKTILDLLAGRGNIFVVGDVKQSIYAFRGAEPQIFIEGLKTASFKPQRHESVRVDLNWNFRSAKDVLDFVNVIFARLMSENFGGIPYDDGAMLQSAADNDEKFLKDISPRVELHLLDEQIERDEQSDESENGEQVFTSARQKQAAVIAQRIRKMVGADSGIAEFNVYDKQTEQYRPVEYRDIVILMRSLAKRANAYLEVIQLAGIPVSSEAAAGYFEATEIRDCLSLLMVLDNPQRDIELAAVLRSPIFRFTDTELAKIRLFSKDDDINYYDCLTAYAKAGDDLVLKNKLSSVMADIESWRTQARTGSIADLLWQIYRSSNLLAFYSALPNGSARRANLLKLHDRAIQFEGFAAGKGSASLGRFVRFIEELQEAGAEWSGAELQDSAGNTVRLMSVHKSKGLEFPVVFLAELDGKFNFTDLQNDVLLGVDMPLGLTIVDRAANAKLTTAAYQILKSEKQATNLAEELRILYVALTRARERLILTASASRTKCETILRKGFQFAAGPIPSWQLADCRTALDWLLYGLSNQKSLHDAFETGINAKDSAGFSTKLYTGSELLEFTKYLDELKKSKQPKKTKIKSVDKSGLIESVKKSLTWQYQSPQASVLPAKQSVTQLTHYNDQFVQVDYSRSLQKKPVVVLDEEIKKDLAVEGRVIGTAAHLIIAQLDLTKNITTDSVRQAADRLIANGSITPDALGCINIDSIAEFFKTDIGRPALDSQNKVRREWPFTFSLSVDEVDKLADPDEFIVVQGMVDMLIETPAGLIIIDFKTDRVSANQIDQRANLYARQIRLYARAAANILKKPVIGKWLYFLSVGKAVEIG